MFSVFNPQITQITQISQNHLHREHYQFVKAESINDDAVGYHSNFN